ncbi:MAG: bifunctional oligoribonuclease/PAP phosphatase NrnA [Prevotellaceae bacterium]|jgi:phosphoesterase RecJ-like protein|nr:bifunctional oligoribonuclease/PAP phosphatase NrnA [Prevotellaceae bacterium]
MIKIFSDTKIAELLGLLNTSKKIAIVTHVNPDGDAIGSVIGWSNFLRERGFRSVIIVPNHFPDFLKWINGTENIYVCFNQKDTCVRLLKEADLLFCLDFNKLSRLDAMGEFIMTLDIKKVLIDHHIGVAEKDFTLMFSKTPMSSTCEIVYRIIWQITKEKSVSPQIAEALYAGIMTDTGAFTHSCSSELFHIVADLMECGINREKIHSAVYNSFSVNRMRLMGYCITKMEVLPEYRTAYITLTKEELERFEFEPGDTEGFVNIPLSIKNVMLSVFFTESKEGYIKLSLRSVGEFSVDEMARKYFNGGGHKNASGGKSFASLDETVEFFKSILPEYPELKNLSYLCTLKI